MPSPPSETPRSRFPLPQPPDEKRTGLPPIPSEVPALPPPRSPVYDNTGSTGNSCNIGNSGNSGNSGNGSLTENNNNEMKLPLPIPPTLTRAKDTADNKEDNEDEDEDALDYEILDRFHSTVPNMPISSIDSMLSVNDPTMQMSNNGAAGFTPSMYEPMQPITAQSQNNTNSHHKQTDCIGRNGLHAMNNGGDPDNSSAATGTTINNNNDVEEIIYEEKYLEPDFRRFLSLRKQAEEAEYSHT